MAELASRGLDFLPGEVTSGASFSGVLVSDFETVLVVFSDPSLESFEERDFDGCGDVVLCFLFWGEKGVCFSVSSKSASLKRKCCQIGQIKKFHFTFLYPCQGISFSPKELYLKEASWRQWNQKNQRR